MKETASPNDPTLKPGGSVIQRSNQKRRCRTRNVVYVRDFPLIRLQLPELVIVQKVLKLLENFVEFGANFKIARIPFTLVAKPVVMETPILELDHAIAIGVLDLNSHGRILRYFQFKTEAPPWLFAPEALMLGLEPGCVDRMRPSTSERAAHILTVQE